MLKYRKRIFGQAHHPRNILSRYHKWLCAQHNGAFAALLKGNAVMQTAR